MTGARVTSTCNKQTSVTSIGCFWQVVAVVTGVYEGTSGSCSNEVAVTLIASASHAGFDMTVNSFSIL